MASLIPIARLRSKDNRRFASKKWKCDVTSMGTSERLVTERRIDGFPSLRATGSLAGIASPGRPALIAAVA